MKILRVRFLGELQLIDCLSDSYMSYSDVRCYTGFGDPGAHDFRLTSLALR